MSVDLNQFSFIETKVNKKTVGTKNKGIVTIVNAEAKNCGSRLVISKELEESLSLRGQIQIAIANDGNSIMLGESIDKTKPLYSLRREKKDKSSSRYVLYGKDIIMELTDKLHLDFSNSVSYTFYDVEITEINDILVAILKKEDN